MSALVSLAAPGKRGAAVRKRNNAEIEQPTLPTGAAETEGTAMEAPNLEAIREKAYAEAAEAARLAYRAWVLELIARAQAVGCPVAVAHAAIRQGLDPDQAQAIVDAAGVASGPLPEPGRTH